MTPAFGRPSGVHTLMAAARCSSDKRLSAHQERASRPDNTREGEPSCPRNGGRGERESPSWHAPWLKHAQKAPATVRETRESGCDMRGQGRTMPPGEVRLFPDWGVR